MSNLSQFFGSGSYIGEIKSFAVPPSDASWVFCDNSTPLKSTYPTLSGQLPASFGGITSTIRNLSFTPISSASDTNGSLWLQAGPAGTTIYSSTDFVSWTPITLPQSVSVTGIKWLGGTNWVIVTATSYFGAFYSSNNGSSWTLSTGMSPTQSNYSNNYSIAYAPGIGVNGRLVKTSGSSTTVEISDDLGHTWTVITLPAGHTVNVITWTGTYFLAMSNIANAPSIGGTASVRSIDGVTWSTYQQPFYAGGNSYNFGFYVSDGAGKVAYISPAGIATPAPASITNGTILFSTDHGVTWASTRLPSFDTVDSSYTFENANCSYANGRFIFLSLHGTCAMTQDFKSWQFIGNIATNLSTGSRNANITYGSGKYLVTMSGIANNISWIEDNTKFHLPPQIWNGNSGGGATVSDWPTYIKAY